MTNNTPLEEQSDPELLEGIYARNRILEERRLEREPANEADALRQRLAELEAAAAMPDAVPVPDVL